MQVARSAGGSVSASSTDARKNGAMGSALLICHIAQPPHHPQLQFFRLVCFPNFWISGEALLLTGLCLIWFRITIFSLGHALPYSIISGSSMKGGCSSSSHYSEGGGCAAC